MRFKPMNDAKLAYPAHRLNRRRRMIAFTVRRLPKYAAIRNDHFHGYFVLMLQIVEQLFHGEHAHFQLGYVDRGQRRRGEFGDFDVVHAKKAMSSGIRRPCSVAARMAAIAIMSLAAKMAVGLPALLANAFLVSS